MVIKGNVKLEKIDFPANNIFVKAPPAPAKILGVVTNEFTDDPLPFVKVTFFDKVVMGDADGEYVIENPPQMSGPLKFELPGFITKEQIITAPSSGTLNIDISLTPKQAPPTEPYYAHEFVLKAFDELIEGKFVEAWNSFLDSFSHPISPDITKSQFTYDLAIMALPTGTAGRTVKLKELLKTETWLNIIDIIKLNPLEYVDDFKKLTTSQQIKILQTIRKDVAASFARDVFGKAFDAQLLAKAPLWKRTLFSFEKHKGTGIFGLIALVGSVIGYDLWANWSIVDNLQFLTGKTADQIKDSFNEGKISKANALSELNQLLAIATEGNLKVKSSTYWNIMQILFAPLWDDLSALTVKNLNDAIAYIQSAPEPVIKAHLKIIATPASSKIEVTGQYAATGTFDKDLDPGTYDVVVSAFQYTTQRFSIILEEAESVVRTVTLIKPEVPPPTKGKMNLTVVPADAIIAVSGFPDINSPGIYDLDVGTYIISVTKEGYYGKSVTVIIKAAETTIVSVTLDVKPPEPPVKEYGFISFSSDPSQTKIYLDSEYQFEQTPTTLKLEVGNYTWTGKKTGYYDNSRPITVLKDQTKVYSLTLSAIPPGEEPPNGEPPPEEEIEVFLVPITPDHWRYTIKAFDSETNEELHAQILFDGVPTGNYCPWTFIIPPETTFNLKLRKKSYRQYEEEITTDSIPAGTDPAALAVTITAQMVKSGYNAWKYTFKTIDSITGDSINAKISIEDIDQGVWTPWYFYLAPSSTYLFRFERYGYYPGEITVTTDPLPT